jgi:hypothetical protein
MKLPINSRRDFLKTVGLGTATVACGQRLLAADPTLSTHGGPVGGVAPEAMLDTYLDGLAFAALDRRQAAYEALKTPADIQAYQTRLRSFFVQQLGGFPERTPLKARVVGQVQGDGYRIEKVIYESLPGFPVTANLYLPATPPPYPAVLFSCGHSANGKAIETYQLACALMARHGLAVLSYDPVGQGERLQYVPDGTKPLYGPTQEHHLLGLRCRLVGVELARFFIWDGMRGIDYLQTRPDIIADRIGATGNSGGGTLTSYLMALDDRITCAAPSCYLTGFRRLLQTIGPQDYEQNIYGQIEGGLDHADYVLLRAPKPTLMCVATHDFFDIQGAWDIFRQAKRIYTRLGAPESVDLVEADEKHGFSLRLREGATRWLRRWLTGTDAPVRETAIKLPDEKSLLCTAEGQVLRVPGVRSLFDVLAEHEGRFRPRRPTTAAIRQAAGIRTMATLPAVRPEKTGDVTWQGRAGERVILSYDSGLWLSALHFPAGSGTASSATILYLPDGGKKAGVEKGGLGKLLRDGSRVLTFDLPGLGEMRAAAASGPTASDAADRRQAQKALLLGRNLVALRAEAILLGLRFLGAPGGVRLVCGQEAAIAALHAAAVEPALFSSVELPVPPSGWAEFVRTPTLTLAAGAVVPRALMTYDLPDLLPLIPTGKLQPATA